MLRIAGDSARAFIAETEVMGHRFIRGGAASAELVLAVTMAEAEAGAAATHDKRA